MAKVKFQTLDETSASFWALVGLHVVLVALGLGAALYMEEHGHIVTGMNNQIVWGLPHVFAVFLIVSASGALNVASVSSVFNRLAYKPYARLSGILAIALLAGGLAVLVLDLGRPERLIVAILKHNFKSIFAWNIYLYTGFMVIVAAYLFAMMDRRASQNATLGKSIGWLAFAWRLILTTGTGSIFGFLIARELYDSAIMAPLFISASFLYGLAFTVLVLIMMSSETRAELMTEEMIGKFRGLLAIFALATLFLTIVQHVTRLYSSAHVDAEMFILRDGGIYTLMFWGGQILLGTLLPLGLLAARGFDSGRRGLTLTSMLFLAGGLAQMYVIIIGGEAFPLKIFPGYEVSSSFADGAIGRYIPTLPEALLGISGISIAMLLTAVALRLLPFLPQAAPEKA